MTDDEKTAESAAGLKRSDPIEQIRELVASTQRMEARRKAGLRFEPSDPDYLAESKFVDDCEKHAAVLLTEIDELQAQLGAVVEECIRAACEVAIPYPDIERRLRSLHPSATKALARRMLDARREEAAHWHDSAELSAGCFVGVCPGCIRVAEIDAQLAALDKENSVAPRPKE